MFTPTSDDAPAAHEAALAPVGEEDLHRAYIWSINSAIESGGGVLVDELTNAYRHESSELSKRRLLRRAA